MYYGTERRHEGFRAFLSVAAIAAGLVLSSMAASPGNYLGEGPVPGPEGTMSLWSAGQRTVARCVTTVTDAVPTLKKSKQFSSSQTHE